MRTLSNFAGLPSSLTSSKTIGIARKKSREFGRIIRDSLRRFDVFGRQGGDEFAILLPDTDQGGAMRYCERLRAGISAAVVRFNGVQLQMTASMGLALLTQDTVSADEAISQADRALYDSKARGRNRITVADGTAAPAEMAAP